MNSKIKHNNDTLLYNEKVYKTEATAKKAKTYENNDKDFTNLQTLYNTTKRNGNVCNLLLLKNDTAEHLCWIKDLSKLKR